MLLTFQATRSKHKQELTIQVLYLYPDSVNQNFQLVFSLVRPKEPRKPMPGPTYPNELLTKWAPLFETRTTFNRPSWKQLFAAQRGYIFFLFSNGSSKDASSFLQPRDTGRFESMPRPQRRSPNVQITSLIRLYYVRFTKLAKLLTNAD